MTRQQKAAEGVKYLKDAILDYLGERPDGVRHADIVTDLGLACDYEGGQKNYLSFSIIGILLAERKVRYERQGGRKLYFRC